MKTVAPQMREELARSAFELFSEHGFKNVNLDAIAAHAGVTKGSLYWHYRSRKEVILAACAHYYREWHRRFHTAILTAADPLERLQRAVLCSVDNCILNRSMRVFVTEVYALALHDAEIRAGWLQFLDAARESFVGLVEDARVAGKIPTTDVGRAVDLMLAAMDGIEKQAAFDPGMCSPDRRLFIYDDLMRIVCET
jgi:AcrR family transcriptional regulator